jgi:hypothetical protein
LGEKVKKTSANKKAPTKKASAEGSGGGAASKRAGTRANPSSERVSATRTPARKTAKKAAAKKTATKKAAAKKTATKKAAAKKTATKKAAAKKTATKKAAAKKTAPPATPAEKTETREAPATPASAATSAEATEAPQRRVEAVQKQVADSRRLAREGKRQAEQSKVQAAQTRAEAEKMQAESQPSAGRKVVRYARGEARKKPGAKRVGTNGGSPQREAPTLPTPVTPATLAQKERMSVAAQQRALVEQQFAEIAPALSRAAAEPEEEHAAPSYRGGPPSIHQSPAQAKLSLVDQLTTAVRNAKRPEDARRAAHDLIDELGQLPPDQALLTRVLTFRDDRLLEKALDELLELDGRGKVRASPELTAIVKKIDSPNRDVQYLQELLLEKLGAAR